MYQLFNMIFSVRFLAVLGFVFTLPALASLQTGWRENGWLDSYEIAQTQSKKQNLPLLIYFDAAWCSWCIQYKKEVLDKPAVQAELKKYFIPVVIDYDARPDLFRQYGGVGLPFTVIVSPRGKIINRFSGILSEKDFLATLKEVHQKHDIQTAERNAFTDRVTVRNTDRAAFDRYRQAWLSHLETLYSPTQSTLSGHYETGATLKRPSPRTWLYLLQNKLWTKRALRAIRIESGRLMDEIDGGYFNYFDSNRIGDAYLESSKLLEVNAWMINWFALAAKHDRAAKHRVEPGWYFLRNVLWDKDKGGFWQAQVANNAYYEASLPLRRKLMPPPVDKIKRADTNAQAAIALYQAGRSLGNGEMQGYARKTLDFIMQHMFVDGVLYHAMTSKGVSVKALPEDTFWVLLAAIEFDSARYRPGLNQLTGQANQWLSVLVSSKRVHELSVEQAGLIVQVVCNKKYRPVFFSGACNWSIKQLHINADTPPDAVVPGLQAWQTAMSYLSAESGTRGAGKQK